MKASTFKPSRKDSTSSRSMLKLSRFISNNSFLSNVIQQSETDKNTLRNEVINNPNQVEVINELLPNTLAAENTNIIVKKASEVKFALGSFDHQDSEYSLRV